MVKKVINRFITLLFGNGNANKLSAFVIGVIVSISVFSQEDNQLLGIYLDVEKAYLTKDLDKLSQVLSDDYLMTSIIYVEDGLQTSRVQNKVELLAALEKTHTINKSGASQPSNVQISKSQDDGFCGVSVVESSVTLNDEKFKESEMREICFVKSKEGFKAIKHRLEYIYR